MHHRAKQSGSGALIEERKPGMLSPPLMDLYQAVSKPREART